MIDTECYIISIYTFWIDIIIIHCNSVSISIHLVTNIYTDHSICLDLLLPAFCQLLIYPVANEGSDMVMHLMMYFIYTMKYNSYTNLKCKCRTLLESVHSNELHSFMSKFIIQYIINACYIIGHFE